MITRKQNKCKVYKGSVEKAGPRIKKLAGAQMPGIMRKVEHTHTVSAHAGLNTKAQTNTFVAR